MPEGVLLAAPRAAVLEQSAQVREGLVLPDVEEAGLDPELVAELGDRHLIDEMPAEDVRLLLRCKLATLA